MMIVDQVDAMGAKVIVNSKKASYFRTSFQEIYQTLKYFLILGV
jgi:hypothetical protein